MRKLTPYLVNKLIDHIYMSMFLSAMFWNGIKKCEAKLPAIHCVHMVDWMELNFWLEINLFPCLETKVWQTFTVWSVNKVNIVIIFGLMTKFSAEDEQLQWGYSVLYIALLWIFDGDGSLFLSWCVNVIGFTYVFGI